MSDSLDPAPRPDEPIPPMVIPVRRPPRAPRDPGRGSGGGLGRLFLVLLLLASIGLNFLLCMGLVRSGLGAGSDADDDMRLIEKHYSGSTSHTTHDKVAVIRIDGPLIDELMGYTHKQIDKAAKDPDVKAVVVRINSRS